MRRLLLACLTTLAGIGALAGAPGAAAAHSRAPTGTVATGSGGSVASMDVSASRAGIAVLERGGNAIDAAVATASTLGVTVPFVAGPGGGGFMVIYLARRHEVITIDGRETCPAACRSTTFLDPFTGAPLDYDMASDQPLSTGTPGTVATWAAAVSRYGRDTLGADLQPAIGVATNGFRVNRDFRQLTESDLPELRAYPASRALLLTAQGDPLALHSLLRNPDLANTYRQLAAHGPSYLYDGPLGQAIASAVQDPVLTPGEKVVTRGGLLTTADLAAYRTRILKPTKVTYRGLQIDGMPPPSSSGTTIGESLNILSGFRLSTEPRARALFDYLEATRLAYADRDRYVGDPRFVKVPVRQLLSRRFAYGRRCQIGRRAPTAPVGFGDPFVSPFCGSFFGQRATPAAGSPEPDETNNIVTTDRQGDIVAYTNTINFFGGSGEVVPGYGFLLNDELTDFDFAAPDPTVPDPNLPAAGKEPRSSMGPVIAFDHGRPLFAIGAAGGSTIPTTILQTLINHVDFGMSLPAALAAPRVSQTNNGPAIAEPAFYHSELAKLLERRYGEKFELATGPILPLDHYPGDATAVQILLGGRVQAVAEPYRLYGGSALVVHPGG